MKIILVLYTFLSILFTASLVRADKADWVHFVTDPRFDHYYNRATLARTPEDIVGVWVKVVPKGKEALEELMRIRRINGFLMEGFEDYQYSTTALEIDCRELKSALIEQRDYGKAGKILDKVRAVMRNWQEISPGSYHDLYQQVLCKKKGK